MNTSSRFAISIIPLLLTNVACSGKAYEIGRAFPDTNPDSGGTTGSGGSGASTAGYTAGPSGAPARGGAGAGGTAAAMAGRPGMGSGATAGMGATGGASGVAGAGAAGSGGMDVGAAGSGGTVGTVTGCTLRVPQDYKTIPAAVAAAMPSAVVCVAPGTYEYQGTIYRDGVSLRGTGPGVVLCNALQGLGDPPSGITTTIENFDIPYGIYISEYTDLTLRNLRVGSGLGPLGCDPNAPHGGGSGTVGLKTGASAEVHLDIEQVTLFSPELTIDRAFPTSIVVHDSIDVSRSTCLAPGKFISLYLQTDPTVPIPDDSRILMDISNNLSVNTTVAGIQIFGSALPAGMIAGSKMEVRNNTIISKGDSGYGIALQVPQQFPSFVVANNVVSYMSNPFFAGSAKPTLAGNFFSQKPDSEPWFTAWSKGDFHPATGSPLIGAADMHFSPAIDIEGAPREPAPDVGAFQH